MSKKGAQKFSGARGLVKPIEPNLTVEEALEDAERESLKKKAREHTDDMLDVLVRTAKGRKGQVPHATRRLAANDVLTWGYGRPAVSEERASGDEGGLTIILQGFGGVLDQPEEIDVTPRTTKGEPPLPDGTDESAPTEGAADFEPLEFDVEELAGA